MRGKATIVINGRHYDAATGLMAERGAVQAPRRHVGNDMAEFEKPVAKFASPIHKPEEIKNEKSSRKHTTATAVHGSPQRSQTLVRSAVKKPASAHQVEHKREHIHVTKSPHITKFAKHPQPIQKRVEHQVAQIETPQVHHKAVGAQHTMPTKQISSRAIKEHLVNEQLEKAQPRHEEYEPRRSKGRFTSLATASLALVLLGGYLTYINMPSLSIRVAAVQAGIEATLPEYHPDGYRFNGPASYAQGEVDMTFSANAGPQSYSIVQKASDWDSQAVLDNYVMKESNGEYNIRSTQGLTVYTFGTKAAWVNDGILHVIDYNNAPLSYSQIERIAASM
jgi:hypothetical protein